MSTSDRFQIAYPGCKTQVAVSLAHVGKKGRCPSCKTVFPIVAPAASAPVVADLVPLGPADLQPLPFGLQPLPAGLQPLQPMQQSWPQNPQPAWQNAGIPNPYGQSAAASPFGQTAPSPFDQGGFGQGAKPTDDDLRLEPASNPYAAPQAQGHLQQAAFGQPPKPSAGNDELNGSLWGGIGMMVLAVVWFFVALIFFDTIFFYPPILFIIGLVAFIKGLVNLASG